MARPTTASERATGVLATFLDHLEGRPHFAGAARKDSDVASEQLRQSAEIARMHCRRRGGHELRVLRIDLGGACRRRLRCRTVAMRVHVRVLEWQAYGRSGVAASSVKVKSNTSCSRDAVPSAAIADIEFTRQ